MSVCVRLSRLISSYFPCHGLLSRPPGLLHCSSLERMAVKRTEKIANKERDREKPFSLQIVYVLQIVCCEITLYLHFRIHNREESDGVPKASTARSKTAQGYVA